MNHLTKDNAFQASEKVPATTTLPLQAHTLALTKRHLIEASAGTGKTFNITRIYLRMLLERQLNVENILVMTFTKAATEEIRGRIDEFLRESLSHWQQYTSDANNEFFYQLGKQVEYEQAKVLIKKALLHLDEAAIYTIHGFCKRVLSQQAFASGMNFNANMESNDSDLLLQACQDHYRVLAAQEDISEYQLLVDFWSTPDVFLVSFKSLLYQQNLPTVTTHQDLISQIQSLVNGALLNLNTQEPLIFEYLVDNKSGKAKQTRITEFEQLRADLQTLKGFTLKPQCVELITAFAVDFKFIAAGRLPRGESNEHVKQALKDTFEPIEQLKKILKDFGNALRKIASGQVALNAIKAIKNKVLVSKRQLNLLNFDDLIIELANGLKNEVNSSDKVLTNALRAQYPVALVDEFQDTDSNQFDILKAVYFPHNLDDAHLGFNTYEANQNISNCALGLYLIGDPKQAIYGFRGGDIFTYLKAGNLVDCKWVMDTNWRSSSLMINAYNHFFYGGDLSKPSADVFGFNIEYQPVKASALADSEQLLDQSDYKALQFIDFSYCEDDIYQGSLRSEFKGKVAHWCAIEVSRLLQHCHLHKNDTNVAIQANDIAILVRNGAEAALLKKALNSLNIDSVYKSQRDNLFTSIAAQEFVHVLNAIINHEDDRAFITALAGPYFGYDPSNLFTLQQDEMQWEKIRGQFNHLRNIWHQRGFMAMALRLLHDHYPNGGEDAERQLTNIIHLFELLQAASQRLKLPLELLAYLQNQCLNPTDNEAELRLESDANLIQIVTLHGSKGLEYPIVFIPFASQHKHPCKFRKTQKQVLVYHDEHGQFIHHLGDNSLAYERMEAEGYAEDTRLLYVGVTRAKHRCYLICGDFKDHHLSPVGRALQLGKGQSLEIGINPLIAQNPESMAMACLSVEGLADSRYESFEQTLNTQVATFTGNIERDWWLSSFSALTRNVKHVGRMQPDRDELSQKQRIIAQDDIRFSFVKGAKTGNFLHDVFERTDFSQPKWHEIGSRYLTKFGQLPQGHSANDVWTWFEDCLHAPLSNHGLSLSELSWSQTLREAEFYFPMVDVELSRLKALLYRFRQQLISPEKLPLINHELPSYGQLKGMMHGFIDLIFCQSNEREQDQYFVCDYKSSYLGDDLSDYQRGNLTEHIIGNFYDLQFLIYSLALHRYLQCRVDNYQFKQHFGGVYYLYLRGMSRENVDFNGVFFHALNEDLMNELDAIFKGQPHLSAPSSNTLLNMAPDQSSLAGVNNE